MRKAARIELSRRNFWQYCLFYDYDFFTRRPFLQEVAEAFQFVYDEYKAGRSTDAAVSMPPRSGKSYLTSLFCSWFLGKEPELSVMRNTCTATLYQKFSYDVRNILRTDKFAEVFPEVRLADDKQNLNGWNTNQSKQVGYFGSGVGGTIIGFGANIAITDDLYRGIDDALSTTYNDSVHQWKQATHDSRKEKNCPEIYIGTRWGLNDVIGKAIETGKVDKAITIPALTPENKSFCEDVKSTAEYLEIEKDIDPMIWEAEYMQNPIELKGILFQRDKLNYFRLADYKRMKDNARAVWEKNNPRRKPGEKMQETKLGYWDIADDGDDSLSAAIGDLIEGETPRIFITDILHTQDNVDITIPISAEMIARTGVSDIRIESNNQGSVFGKWLKQRPDVPEDKIWMVRNTTNKNTRIIMSFAFVMRYVHFLHPDDVVHGSDYWRFMKELTSYMRNGTSKHDDAPDCLAGLCRMFESWFPELFPSVTQ